MCHVSCLLLMSGMQTSEDTPLVVTKKTEHLLNINQIRSLANHCLVYKH